MVDTGTSTEGAKVKYQALRPFVVHGEEMCTPDEDTGLRADGSCPSGPTALGFGGAFALTQVIPKRPVAIRARGRIHGESRVVCNVHWQGYNIAGRFMAAAMLARPGALPEFGEDVKIAQAEGAAARAKGLIPGRDCTAEAEALALRLPGAL